MKQQRHTAIRDLLVTTSVLSQDELRKKLAKRGITVTQATLSRDIQELRVMKGPNGYALPENGAEADDMPSVRETLGELRPRRETGAEPADCGNPDRHRHRPWPPCWTTRTGLN